MVRLTDVRDKENAFGSWCPGRQLSGLRRRERRASAEPAQRAGTGGQPGTPGVSAGVPQSHAAQRAPATRASQALASSEKRCLFLMTFCGT